MSGKAAQRKRAAEPHASAALAHFRFGWWSLVVFVLLGLVLEALHGLKVGAYLDVSNETRRLLWTLAHAHGALISILHVAFGATLASVPGLPGAGLALASRGLYGATALMPTGFFLGGLFLHDGDPGLGVLLVPAGGLLLLVAVFATARAIGRAVDGTG